ncbi:MAG: hypothetical protein FRX49_10945 [Trebouxia sp. A1-2]|nr:MAG: hypothetical protein FRX49_10945 [Trebouxia sp. A1-2]
MKVGHHICEGDLAPGVGDVPPVAAHDQQWTAGLPLLECCLISQQCSPAGHGGMSKTDAAERKKVVYGWKPISKEHTEVCHRSCEYKNQQSQWRRG